MSDKMIPIPFGKLMNAIAAEYAGEGTIFGERDFYKAPKNHTLNFFNEKLETPFGPAAGPHTQLAQNIVAAYLCGARFFELKTVQKLDGDDLPVSKPCILAEDEGYNVEWSTELYVEEAYEEYVKAWFILHVLSKELELGSPDGFVFNMSVGYDLEGIKLLKIDNFIENLKDASKTKIFRECREFLKKHINEFKKVTLEDIDVISPHVCTSITLSTLHGCPAGEIERIAAYLISEKKLNTFIKCNPTLLGYDFARNTMDRMGYDYLSFTDFHFKDDLQYEDAVPMLKRLMALADENNLAFGVKITNTFPVEIKCNELPGEEMYMSGRALYPLSISLAAKLSSEFEGKLRISYSGGADVTNIGAIVDSGIWPVTVATTILKPGGYARLKQIAGVFSETQYKEFAGVDARAVRALADEAATSKYHIKDIKPRKSRKSKKELPLMNCFMAPCSEACPINQDISAYMELVDKGDYAGALRLIMTKNPLPHITGTICPHNCMQSCTRDFYETSVQIRNAKLLAAKRGYDEVLASLSPKTLDNPVKIAIVGGGPAGLAAAYFLKMAGNDVTIFNASSSLGGVVRNVIPSFRIPGENILADISFIEKLGVNIKVNTRITSRDELKDYDKIIFATGAAKPGEMKLMGDKYVNALTFLKDFKASEGKTGIGRGVAVIGGGNTAMDTARAAVRTVGVEKVYLVYRRTARYMPADEEELKAAIDDGVKFLELRSPISFIGGKLKCQIMQLGEPDESGRRSPEATGEFEEIEVDTVIAAVGEKVDGAFYKNFGLDTDEKGLPVVDAMTMKSSDDRIYIIGDGRRGPATVVEAIADARRAADDIINGVTSENSTDGGYVRNPSVLRESLYAKKGYICEPFMESDYGRCLNCSLLCENCVDVCPNRANVAINVVGMDMPQILHVDKMCNECGNCKIFCPYAGAPYKDKLTLFDTYGDMKDSTNNGFCFLRPGREMLKLRLYDKEYAADNITDLIAQGVDGNLVRFIEAVYRNYSYLC